MMQCVIVPKRAFTISMKVCMCDARRLTWMAKTAKSKICTVAPDAYQKGPEMPTLQPMFEDMSKVAAHVHCDTITAAVRPTPTSRPAVLNCSEDIERPRTPSSNFDRKTVTMLKK